ncbi:hypothetical protein [Rhodoglobus sp.]
MSDVNIRPFRIVAWWAKLAFYCTYLISGRLLFFVLDSAGAPPAASLVCGVAFSSLAFVVGVRTFRGAAEPLAAPRPWWRATARPPAGFILGMLTTILALNEVWLLVVETPHGPFALAASIISLLQTLLVTGYFFNSSVRLLALPLEPKPAPSGLVQPSLTLRDRRSPPR